MAGIFRGVVNLFTVFGIIVLVGCIVGISQAEKSGAWMMLLVPGFIFGLSLLLSRYSGHGWKLWIKKQRPGQ
ncbi:hypothetical protein [Spongorhabdus nitratireducens]